MKQTNTILHALKRCIPESEYYALHEPQFLGNEWHYVKTCLDTGWVSSVGQFVDRFEKDLQSFTGAKHAIVTTNGTAALHMCFILAGVQPGDEVLTPTLSFIATCNAIHYCGATPHFVDSEEQSLGVDPDKLSLYLEDNTIIKKGVCFNKKTNKPIRALCVMHTFGHPVDLDRLYDLANRFHLQLVEDAAEALGSYYKGKHVGHFGAVGALSFNGNKIMTTGGGGAILTDDDKIAARAKHLTTTAKQPHPWLYQHDEIGFNYRLPNINAALGCAQLEQIEEFLQQKRQLAARYQQEFECIPGIDFMAEPAYAKSNYWLNALILTEAGERDTILEQLNVSKIGARPMWELMHHLPMYIKAPQMDLSTAEKVQQRVINIPSSVALGEMNVVT
jgi:perosamine synthetase